MKFNFKVLPLIKGNIDIELIEIALKVLKIMLSKKI